MNYQLRDAEPNDIWDVKDCARFLNMTEQGVRKAIKEQRLRAKKFGNSWVIREQDLHRFGK